MTKIETAATIPKTELIPVIGSDIFSGRDSTFALILAASVDEVLYERELQGSGRLRAKVYIDEKKFLPPDSRNADGTEFDDDDDRSRHYVALERLSDRQARVIGTMRTIVKLGAHTAEVEPDAEPSLLPAEKFFPDAFAVAPAPKGSIEASRFISRHENAAVQKAVFASLIRTVIRQAYDLNNRPIFAVVEQNLKDNLQESGMPFDVAHDLVEIEEYDYTMNMLLRFDPGVVLEAIKKGLPISPFFTEVPGDGLGYYGNTLLNLQGDGDDSR